MNSFSSPSRRLRRLYSDQDLSASDTLVLTPGESRHALCSLRLQTGDRCLIINGKGWEAEACLESPSEEGAAVFKILKANKATRGFSIPVTVLPALIKKGKMDALVEKAQEFGASFFQPLVCERSEFEISADRFEAVSSRWNKIAQEAAKQSGASRVLSIAPPVRFLKRAAEISPETLVLIFHPWSPAQDWVEVADEIRSSGKVFSQAEIWIGPEGGFSEPEIRTLSDLECPHLYFVSMGSTVLKADTAFVAALAGTSFFI